MLSLRARRVRHVCAVVELCLCLAAFVILSRRRFQGSASAWVGHASCLPSASHRVGARWSRHRNLTPMKVANIDSSLERPLRFHLATSSWLQGDAVQLKRANICLVFQVNCPGCFSHALPMMVELSSKYAGSDDVALFAVATAFEDFSLNTKEHVEALLRDGEVVGATMEYLLEVQGKERWDLSLPFPVGFDKVEATPTEPGAIKRKARQRLDAMFVSGRLGSRATAEAIRDEGLVARVADALSSKPFTAETFDTNCLSGTPSWAVFCEDGTICGEWLGARPASFFEELVQVALERPSRTSAAESPG